MTLDRAPNIVTIWIIGVARLLIILYHVIFPSPHIPKAHINHTRLSLKYSIISISIIGSILIVTNPSIIIYRNTYPPIVIVADQSYSMTATDLWPTRRSIAQSIVNQINTQWLFTWSLITYWTYPYIHSWRDNINTLQPLHMNYGGSALWDARLIAYDHMQQYYTRPPIIITITDGGANTGYDITQTSLLLQEQSELRIVGISSGEYIVWYDSQGRWLVSSMNSELMQSTTTPWKRYHITSLVTRESISKQIIQDLLVKSYTDISQYPLNIRWYRIIGIMIVSYRTSYYIHLPKHKRQIQ